MFSQKGTLSEVHQNSHAVLFRYLKQYSACVFLKFASFLRRYVCEKNIFPRASSGDLSLNEKQKKTFVSLNDEVTTIH